MRACAVALLLCFLACSPKKPSTEDLERVRNSFLQLRFNAVLIPELKAKKDMEIFETSCRAKRVDCKQVLELLKEEDLSFYKRLNSK